MDRQKNFTTRIGLVFVLGNAVLLTLLYMHVLSPRIDRARLLDHNTAHWQRLLAAREYNLYTLPGNQVRLANLRTLPTDHRYLQPRAETGAALELVRQTAALYRLRELEFYANLRGVHHAGHHAVHHAVHHIEGMLSADGHYADVLSFLATLTAHERYFRCTRILLYDPDHLNWQTGSVRLRLAFSVYLY